MLGLQKLDEGFGLEANGIDLSAPLDDETFRQVWV